MIKRSGAAMALLCLVVGEIGMGSVSGRVKTTATAMAMGRSCRTWFLIPFLLICTAMQQPRDPEKDTRAILQANYLYNIAKLVEWKEVGMRSGNFVIGVLGNANLYQELIKQYSTRSIGSQSIEVRKLPRSAQVERCHILFVGRTEMSLLPEIYKNMRGQPTMVVTEYGGALEDGAVINFVEVENLLKYELHVSNARDHGLVVGATLKNLAHRVEE